jgi:rod shape-determining protein MreB and related proteins
MFEVLSSLFTHDLGVDLGTANTVVYVRGKGILLSEPSVVAIKNDLNRGSRVVAVGVRAQKMIGRTPDNIATLHPLKDGVIADFELTEAMLKYFIARTCRSRFPIKPRILICLPFGSTQVEMRAVWEAAKSVGARAVYLLSEPVAAAIGADLPVQQSTGSMIVDIGGGTTEVAVLSMSDIVHCNSIRVAGHEMDEAIIQHVKRKFGLLIGARTAETIKKVIGSACSEKEDTYVAKGRGLIRGIPKIVTLHSQDITEAISGCVQTIVKTIKEALEQTPPELVSDIVERGIVLSGGGSLLRNLDEVIQRETGVPVFVAKNPLLSVVLGTKAILEDLKIYERLLVRHP